jgi:hypothetical protein
MFEDGLRNFPMAKTDYLQRIRTTQRYQDIITIDSLFKVIVRSVQIVDILEYPGAIHLDWLNYRLRLDVIDLRELGWDHEMVKETERKDGVLIANSVHTTSRNHSDKYPSLISLAQCLRCLAHFDDLESVPSWVCTSFLY